MNIPVRLQRLRRTPAIRAMMQETRLHPAELVAPLFIHEGLQHKKAIQSMPGQYQLSLGDLPAEIQALSACGIQSVILFGIPTHKDERGDVALRDDGIIQRAIRVIRSVNSDMSIMVDLCLCEYTTHGHCGILKNETIDNDQTLVSLGNQALSLVHAGADWIAPSGMMDGMVGYLRRTLDNAHYQHIPIASYSVKYASGLYGPFREAAEGAPKFGDRRSYQMNPANATEALREARLDIEEGADLIMVKPAGFYLDIIQRLKVAYPDVPCSAYQVSGEYALIKHAASAGLVNAQQLMEESLLAIKRAGADLIFTYFAKEYAQWIKEQ